LRDGDVTRTVDGVQDRLSGHVAVLNELDSHRAGDHDSAEDSGADRDRPPTWDLGHG
jgi:hypothetical protein